MSIALDSNKIQALKILRDRMIDINTNGVGQSDSQSPTIPLNNNVILQEKKAELESRIIELENELNRLKIVMIYIDMI